MRFAFASCYYFAVCGIAEAAEPESVIDPSNKKHAATSLVKEANVLDHTPESVPTNLIKSPSADNSSERNEKVTATKERINDAIAATKGPSAFPQGAHGLPMAAVISSMEAILGPMNWTSTPLPRVQDGAKDVQTKTDGKGPLLDLRHSSAQVADGSIFLNHRMRFSLQHQLDSHDPILESTVDNSGKIVDRPSNSRPFELGSHGLLSVAIFMAVIGALVYIQNKMCSNRVSTTTVTTSAESLTPSLWDLIRGLIRGPRQLHLALLLTFLDSIRFFCGASTLPLLLSNEYGFSDYQASLITANSVIVSLIFGFLGSYVIDKYDTITTVSRIGCTISFLSRMAVVFDSTLTHGSTVVILMTLVFFPVVEGCLGPGFRTAIVRLSTNETRSFNFALLYAIQSLGGAFGFTMVDFFKNEVYHLGPFAMSGIRTTFFITGVVMGIAALCTIMMRDERVSSAMPAADDRGEATSRSLIAELFSAKATWSVILFSFFTSFTCMQWQFSEVLLPKSLTRIHGTEVPWGSISSLNLWGCVIGPPIAAAAFSAYDDFDVIIPGLVLFAISPACVFMFDSSLVGSIMWLIVMTTGEVVWSPRFQAFSASLCPPNQQAMFLTLVSMPRIMFSWLGIITSGILLEKFIPSCYECMDEYGFFCDVSLEGGGCKSGVSGNKCPALSSALMCGNTCSKCPKWEEKSNMMWMVICLISLISPCLVISCRNYFASQSARRENETREKYAIQVQSTLC